MIIEEADRATPTRPSPTRRWGTVTVLSGAVGVARTAAAAGVAFGVARVRRERG